MPPRCFPTMRSPLSPRAAWPTDPAPVLATSILPSPNLDPCEVVVAYWLLNPFLLARLPQRMAKARAMFEAGTYHASELRALAQRLQQARNHLHNLVASEPAEPEAYDELRALLQSKHISPSEGKDIGFRLRVARPSEYPWLRRAIEAAITARAAQTDTAFLQAA